MNFLGFNLQPHLVRPLIGRASSPIDDENVPTVKIDPSLITLVFDCLGFDLQTGRLLEGKCLSNAKHGESRGGFNRQSC